MVSGKEGSGPSRLRFTRIKDTRGVRLSRGRFIGLGTRLHFPRFVSQFKGVRVPCHFQRQRRPSAIRSVQEGDFERHPIRATRRDMLRVLGHPQVRRQLFRLLKHVVRQYRPINGLVHLVREICVQVKGVVSVPRLNQFTGCSVVGTDLSLIRGVIGPFRPSRISYTHPVHRFPSRPPYAPFACHIRGRSAPFRLCVERVPNRFYRLMRAAAIGMFMQGMRRRIFVQEGANFLLRCLHLFQTSTQRVRSKAFIRVRRVRVFVLRTTPLPPASQARSWSLCFPNFPRRS